MQVVQGLDLAVPLMHIGETAEITMDARFGFGKLGDAPRVPPSAKLNYTVELVSAEPEPELEDLTVAQRRLIGWVNRGTKWPIGRVDRGTERGD